MSPRPIVIDPSHVLVVKEDFALRRNENGTVTYESVQLRLYDRSELTDYMLKEVTLDPPVTDALDIYKRTDTSFDHEKHPYVKVVGSGKWVRLDSHYEKSLGSGEPHKA
jgi:hypothetical protein